MCLYPKLIQNPKYKKNKKNGGIIPPINDIRVMAVPIACGRCAECMKAKANEWRVRLTEEVRRTKLKGHMITLTFSEESIQELKEIVNDEYQTLEGYELENAIASIAVRRFTERWRKEYKKTVRHWLITELGHQNTERIHLHGIIWTNEHKNNIEKHWKYGHVWSGYGEEETYVNEQTINYIIKYVTKVDEDHRYYIPKIYSSNGMGKDWTKGVGIEETKYKEEGTNEYYRARQGYKTGLPKYYRNKTYTEEERERLWIEKLNKQERWVDGIKIDISKGQEEYIKIRDQAREKYIKLGYNGEYKWSEKEYENQRRTLLQEKNPTHGTAYENPSDFSLIALRAQRFNEKEENKIGGIKPSTEWE